MGVDGLIQCEQAVLHELQHGGAPEAPVACLVTEPHTNRADRSTPGAAASTAVDVCTAMPMEQLYLAISVSAMAWRRCCSPGAEKERIADVSISIGFRRCRAAGAGSEPPRLTPRFNLIPQVVTTSPPRATPSRGM
eukprot:595418-Prymnesium_polylepis.1